MSHQFISLLCCLLSSKRVFSSQLANHISENNFSSCGMFHYEITIFLFWSGLNLIRQRNAVDYHFSTSFSGFSCINHLICASLYGHMHILYHEI